MRVLCVAWLSGMGCATVQLPEPSDVMLVLAQAQAPEATLESLAHGRALVLDRCSNCHVTPEPKDTLLPEWPASLVEMTKEAKITEEQARLVDIYLRAGAALPPPVPAP